MRISSVCLLLTALGLCSFNGEVAVALTITEISYHPRGGGSTLEFIEIHNELTDPVELTGHAFQGVDFVFPAPTFLEAGGYLVVCADESAIRSTFGIENAIGNWALSSALDNRGERIQLLAPGGVVAASVDYDDRAPWPAGADGTGHTLELIHPYSDANRTENWALSPAPGGSPGRAYEPVERLGVLLNEAFLDDALPANRWLELYNSTASPVNVGAYHISTTRSTLTAATLPKPSVIPAFGFLAVSADDIGLDLPRVKDGELYVALSAPGGDRVIDALVFSAAVRGRSDARMPDGAATRSKAATPTRATTNRVDVRRDVVINEIHYNPLPTAEESFAALEFIELFHHGTQTASLGGWRFSDGVRFTFPSGTTLEPGGYLVVTRDPERLSAVYDLPSVATIGPRTEEARRTFGRLSNGGERVTLRDATGNVVDTVEYHDGGEWPGWPDGGGPSLELIDPRQDNSVGQSWDASLDTANSPTQEIFYRGRFNGVDTPGAAELHLVLDGRGIVLVDAIEMREEIELLEQPTTLIATGDEWQFFKGTRAPSTPPEDWRAATFEPSQWLNGPTPIGVGFEDERTLLDDLPNNYVSVFFRRVFETDATDLDRDLVVELEYDDGFAAYLNGVEVGTEHLRDGARAFDSRAVGQHHETARFVIRADRGLLRPGPNVLAVQVHNALRASRDFRFDANLTLGHLVPTLGPNLIVDGEFESPEATSQGWPASSMNPAWTITGTHGRSGQSADAPLAGSGSLKIVATGGGDNKVNRIETSNLGMVAPSPGAAVTVSLLARWLVGSPILLTHGAYSGFRSPSYAASHRLAVTPHAGTPGAQNSVSRRQVERVGSVNLGPVLWEVNRTPAVPSDNVPVSITTRAMDADGVRSVTLHYTFETPRAADDVEVRSRPMDGPDATGLYRGSVPGQPAGRSVVYWITAEDSKGHTGRYPLDHLQRSHPLVLDRTQARPEDARYGLYRHEAADRPATEHLSYRFLLHAASEAYLNSRMILSNDPVDSTLIFGERNIYDSTRLRFAGSPFARGAPWQGSYRVRLPKDRPLHGRLKKFNLENHQGQGGKDARERMSHYLIRHSQGSSRVPYAEQWIVEMNLNDRVMSEFKEHVESPSREYLSRWFPGDDDGPFFEVDDRHNINDSGGRTQSQDARLLYPPYNDPILGSEKEEYRYYFSPRGRNTQDDFADLIELARWMSPAVTPDGEFDQRIDEVIDVEQFLRVWAIRLNTDDWDTWGARRGKNAYLYLPRETGRWVLLPWDMELTYGESNSFPPPRLQANEDPLYGNAFAEVERLLNRPQIKRRYYALLRELALGPFDEAFFDPYLRQLETIGLDNLATIRSFLRHRAELLLTATEGLTATAAPFAVTDNRLTGQELTLTGSAPLEVEEIVVLIDGVSPPAAFRPRLGVEHPLRWEAAGRLLPGKREVTSLAFDGHGELFATALLTVVVDEAAPAHFVRGDANASGNVNLTDVIWTFLYLNGEAATICLDAADANDDGQVDLTDVLYSAEFLFRRGAPPAAPFPRRGEDPTEDPLDCARS